MDDSTPPGRLSHTSPPGSLSPVPINKATRDIAQHSRIGLNPLPALYAGPDALLSWYCTNSHHFFLAGSLRLTLVPGLELPGVCDVVFGSY